MQGWTARANLEEWKNVMFHQVFEKGDHGNKDTHMRHMWEHPQILGKLRGAWGWRGP
jgi:hypothetical protein